MALLELDWVEADWLGPIVSDRDEPVRIGSDQDHWLGLGAVGFDGLFLFSGPAPVAAGQEVRRPRVRRVRGCPRRLRILELYIDLEGI